MGLPNRRRLIKMQALDSTDALDTGTFILTTPLPASTSDSLGSRVGRTEYLIQ